MFFAVSIRDTDSEHVLYKERHTVCDQCFPIFPDTDFRSVLRNVINEKTYLSF